MNQERFVQFLQTCAEVLHDQETYVIFDVASPERQSESPADHNHVQMLPFYFPFINIDEETINYLKAAIKNDICPPEIQQEMQNR